MCSYIAYIAIHMQQKVSGLGLILDSHDMMLCVKKSFGSHLCRSNLSVPHASNAFNNQVKTEPKIRWEAVGWRNGWEQTVGSWRGFVILRSSLWMLSPNKYSWQVERVVRSRPPTVGKSLGKSPREKWLCQEPFQSHNSVTLSTHSPHIGAATEPPSCVIPLSLSFLPTYFHFTTALHLPHLFYHSTIITSTLQASLSLFLFSSLFIRLFHSASLNTLSLKLDRCSGEYRAAPWYAKPLPY